MLIALIDFSASYAAFRDPFLPEHPSLGEEGGFRPSSHQGTPRQIKIGQSVQRENLSGILRDPLMAYLRVTELPLDHAKHVLDSCPDRGHLVIEALVRPGQRVLRAGLERDTPEDAGLARQALEPVVDVTLVAEDRPVFLTQEVRQLTDVRGVGRRDRQHVHESGIEVGADMDRHAELSLVALLRLMHLGIMLLILGRVRRVYDRGVDDRVTLEQQATLLKGVVDDVDHLRRQPVLLEQMPELQDRRLVGQRIVGQVKTRKAPHRLDFLPRVFHRRVARLDHRQQRSQSHARLHLRHEALPRSLFFLPVQGTRGEGHLLHWVSLGF